MSKLLACEVSVGRNLIREIFLMQMILRNVHRNTDGGEKWRVFVQMKFFPLNGNYSFSSVGMKDRILLLCTLLSRNIFPRFFKEI